MEIGQGNYPHIIGNDVCISGRDVCCGSAQVTEITGNASGGAISGNNITYSNTSLFGYKHDDSTAATDGAVTLTNADIFISSGTTGLKGVYGGYSAGGAATGNSVFVTGYKHSSAPFGNSVICGGYAGQRSCRW